MVKRELCPFAWLARGALSGQAERNRFIRLGHGWSEDSSLLVHGWRRAL